MLVQMPAQIVRCPVCGQRDAEFRAADPTEVSWFSCEVCGQYGIAFPLLVDRDMAEGQRHPYLSAATRKASEFGRPLTLTLHNWRELEEAQNSIRVSDKVAELLRLIARKCGTPGGVWEIRLPFDYPLIAAQKPAELRSYLHHLQQRGLLTFPEQRASEGKYFCELTIPGWEAIEPALTPNGVQGRCFVAMAFKSSLDDAFLRGIQPAVEDDCGFKAVRMLELEHNDKICDRIIVEVRRAQFVIADFTFQRGGVYFEAGFATALSRPVIWTCNACHFHRLHFDTRQYNHIKWKGPDDLRTQLATRIRETIPGARLIGR